MASALRRGEIVVVAAPGDYGKPRPALVIQSDFFIEHPSVTVCFMTSELRDTPLFRFTTRARERFGKGVPGHGRQDRDSCNFEDREEHR